MVNFRSLFFGSKLKAVVTILLLLGGAVGGAFATGMIGAPGVIAVENRFGEVSNDTTSIETDLIVNNPNPIGVQFGGMSANYSVKMNEISMASGSKEGLAIEQGNSTLNFTTQMQNEKIPEWWVSHIRNAERTQLEIDARVHSSLLGRTATIPHRQEINTDIVSQFNSTETRPINADQPLVSDPILYVNQTSATWGEVSETETPIMMDFVVYNPKETPYTISEIGYEVTMNNISVGAGQSEDPFVIPGETEQRIETTTAINNPTLDEWWVSHLQRNQVTDLQINFYARVELPSGNTIRIPLEELTYTKRIETDFFGTKTDEDSPSDSPPDRTTLEKTTEESDSERTTTDTETDTPADTPTETPTPTPTPSETTTDDDFLLGVSRSIST